MTAVSIHFIQSIQAFSFKIPNCNQEDSNAEFEIQRSQIFFVKEGECLIDIKQSISKKLDW